jgi:PAS domain S-box-containing protein
MTSPAPIPVTASPPLSSPGSSAEFNRVLVEAFLESVPDHVYFKDRESRFVAVSRSLASWVGRTSAEMVGKTDFDFFAEAHARPAFDDEQRIIRTGEPIIAKIEKETWPDGRVTWVQTSKLPFRDETGETVGTFGISKNITQRKQMEADVEQANKQLFDASRRAGMAEVATGVLHNVGNVLNSLNVSAMVVQTGLRQSKADSLAKLAGLLREHASDLGDFVTRDPKGRLVPEFLQTLTTHFQDERTRLLGELGSLQRNIDHIKDIVSMQQSLASVAGVVEALDPASLMEDAVRMNTAALARHEVRLERHFEVVPRVRVERPKALQILVNLVRNAKYALDDGAPAQKVMTLRIEPGRPGFARLIVSDNGIGIPPENLAKIFQRGFTTRKEGGHGFGLHSALNAARDLKATLTVTSGGLGQGATFTLELPLADPAPTTG